jgi:hypothetical protein
MREWGVEQFAYNARATLFNLKRKGQKVSNKVQCSQYQKFVKLSYYQHAAISALSFSADEYQNRLQVQIVCNHYATD